MSQRVPGPPAATSRVLPCSTYLTYVAYVDMLDAVTVLTFDSYSEARDHLKEVLDTADRGEPVVVRRQGHAAAVVNVERLRDLLIHRCPPDARVVPEAGGWSILLPGLPIAADGSTLDQALDEMVLALREYAADWCDHLKDAPNHRENWGLVQMVSLSDDAQIKEWLAGPSA